MPDMSLLDLVHLWVNEEPTEPSPTFRGPECLNVGVLASAAVGEISLTPTQEQHIASCGAYCGRIYALAQAGEEDEEAFWEPDLLFPTESGCASTEWRNLTVEEEMAAGSSGTITTRLQQLVEERTRGTARPEPEVAAGSERSASPSGRVGAIRGHRGD